ncbi:MAG: hypothetical protein ACI8XB_002096 [Patiriisocius sp.]|jgi:hypothetical protein
MNANYNVERDLLEKDIEEYLGKYGYVKSKKPEDGMLFRVKHGGGYKIS